MATQTPEDVRSGNGFRLDDFPATVVASGANVVAQMDFPRRGLNGRGRIGQEIVRTMHPSL